MATGFDLNRMPRESIVPRQQHTWSVHFSIATNNWIATISRPSPSPNPHANDPSKIRYQQFRLPSEIQARKFCEANAPPKFSDTTECRVCRKTSVSHSCRNCGVTICDRCSCPWERKMLPKTYYSPQDDVCFAKTTRVCKSCDWLSNAFCLALLQGRYQDALQIHASGNVNLWTRFAAIHGEAMFPIHCAVMGGSLDLVKWLIDTHLCPFSGHRDPQTNRLASIQTSASRTLLDLVMTGRSKLPILSYLVQKGLSVEDVKDKALIPKTLDLLLMSGSSILTDKSILTLGVDEVHMIEPCAFDVVDNALEDTVCKLCCERTMLDCVLQPCGHQICCLDCGSMLQQCPVCKRNCSVLRIYRQ